MSRQLDLDAAVAGSELAQRQLAELRAICDRFQVALEWIADNGPDSAWELREMASRALAGEDWSPPP